MIHSIQTIHQVIDTGDNPVLVTCDDLNDYVCKHNRTGRVAKKLFSELLCNNLLKALGVKTPPFEFISVREEHTLIQTDCQPAFFKDRTCFGTLYLKEALEWSKFPLDNYKQIINREDLLIIAWFDLWLANEDRNWNNFNLLINPVSSGYEIVPIDHGACLNSGSFEENIPLTILCSNETIIDTVDFREITKGLLKTANFPDEFIERLYLSIPDLIEVYEKTVLSIPVDWNISLNFSDALKCQLFSDEWLDETKTHFISYLTES